MPRERIRLSGADELSDQEIYDIDNISLILSCFMYGVSLGFINNTFQFVDYEKLIVPSMRLVNKELFQAPCKLNLPLNTPVTQ